MQDRRKTSGTALVMALDWQAVPSAVQPCSLQLLVDAQSYRTNTRPTCVKQCSGNTAAQSAALQTQRTRRHCKSTLFHLPCPPISPSHFCSVLHHPHIQLGVCAEWNPTTRRFLVRFVVKWKWRSINQSKSLIYSCQTATEHIHMNCTNKNNDKMQ